MIWRSRWKYTLTSETSKTSERSERIKIMDAKEITKEQELRAVYYDPSAGYRSAEKLYRTLKENGVNISRTCSICY